MEIKPKALRLSIIFLLLSTSNYANTNQAISNDPNGNIFIGKSAGDISNCGPIAALMARKFINHRFYMPNLESSITAARFIVKPTVQRHEEEDSSYEVTTSVRTTDTSWWRTSDIKSYFKQNGIQHHSINVRKGEQAIISELNKGNILIVNLNMNDMPRGFGNTGKPYFTFPIPGGWGHYLVIVGYKYIGNTLVFETHDSFSKSGKSRMYKSSNLTRAVKAYNPQAIVVKRN